MAAAPSEPPEPGEIEWAKGFEQRIYLALLLASTLGWAAYGLLTAKTFFPLLVLRALIVGLGLVVVTASALALPARGLFCLASSRYRRVCSAKARVRAEVHPRLRFRRRLSARLR